MITIKYPTLLWPLPPVSNQQATHFPTFRDHLRAKFIFLSLPACWLVQKNKLNPSHILEATVKMQLSKMKIFTRINHSSYKLSLAFRPFFFPPPSSLTPLHERNQCKWSPTFTLHHTGAQPFRNTVNHSFWALHPTENLQHHLGALLKGMSIHAGWLCVNGCVRGHVAHWDNQIHSDSKWAKQRVILLSQFSDFQPVRESKDEDCRQRKLHGTVEMQRK